MNGKIGKRFNLKISSSLFMNLGYRLPRNNQIDKPWTAELTTISQQVISVNSQSLSIRKYSNCRF